MAHLGPRLRALHLAPADRHQRRPCTPISYTGHVRAMWTHPPRSWQTPRPAHSQPSTGSKTARHPAISMTLSELAAGEAHARTTLACTTSPGRKLLYISTLSRSPNRTSCMLPHVTQSLHHRTLYLPNETVEYGVQGLAVDAHNIGLGKPGVHRHHLPGMSHVASAWLVCLTLHVTISSTPGTSTCLSPSCATDTSGSCCWVMSVFGDQVARMADARLNRHT